MRKLMAIVVCLFLTFCQLSGGTRRALTVFIGDYPKESGWRSISSLNDKALILPMLLKNGFVRDNIICLSDEQATYDAVIAALDELASIVNRGDEVYVHFSCHGQLITDQNRDEALVDPKDKYDESIVPYDAAIAYGWNGYKGEKHLIDDMLYHYMRQIADGVGKKGAVMLVVDACHSGGIERGEDEEYDYKYRGCMDAFDAPYLGAVDKPEIEETTWCSISACKSVQTNFEVEVDGVRYGRLSYAISRSFASELTAEELILRLIEEYKRMPRPRRTQEVSCEIPQSLTRKPMFK